MKNYLLLIFITITLCSCRENTDDPAKETAVAFFDAIYNQKDIEKAVSLSTPKFANEIRKYITAQNFARRVLNMSFDSAKIEPALGDLKFRKEFVSSGKLTVLFTGSRQEKIFKELKTIRLVKKNNIWLVSELLDDPIPS